MSIEVESATDPIEAVDAVKESLAQEEKSAVQESTEETAKPQSMDDEGGEEEVLEASDESKEVDSDEEDSSDEAEAKEKKKLSGWQRTKKRHERELAAKAEEAQYWREQALKASKEEKPQEEKKEESLAGNEPKEDDFEDHIDFIKAQAKYEAKQEIERVLSERDEKSKEQKAKQSFDQKQTELRGHIEKYESDNPGFFDRIDEARDQGIVMSIAVQTAIEADPELTPMILDELLNDLDTFEKINEMSALDTARAIGRIEARVTKKEAKTSEEKKEIQTTKAPRPPKTIGSRTSGSTKKNIYDEDISQGEYEKQRMAQMSRTTF